MMNVYSMSKRIEEIKEGVEGHKHTPVIHQHRKQIKWSQLKFWKQDKPADCCPTCC